MLLNSFGQTLGYYNLTTLFKDNEKIKDTIFCKKGHFAKS